MRKENLKGYLYILGIILLLSGVLLFVLVSGPLQYMGIIFISVAYVYFVSVFLTKFTDESDEHSRNRIRYHIFKHQFRK